MNKFIGTKIISAEPQTCPKIEGMGKYPFGADGYKVVYEDGYESWSPKNVFEDAYRQIDNMSFGLAIEALKKGLKVARAGWNGKGMWLSLSNYQPTDIAANIFWSKNNQDYAESQGGFARVLPCITMKTATGEILMGWLASQTDMLSDDWEIVE